MPSALPRPGDAGCMATSRGHGGRASEQGRHGARAGAKGGAARGWPHASPFFRRGRGNIVNRILVAKNADTCPARAPCRVRCDARAAGGEALTAAARVRCNRSYRRFGRFCGRFCKSKYRFEINALARKRRFVWLVPWPVRWPAPRTAPGCRLDCGAPVGRDSWHRECPRSELR